MSLNRIGGPGISLDTKPLTGNSNQIQLAAGETFVFPAGQFYVNPGLYTFLQVKDPLTGLWVPDEMNAYGKCFITADGANVRLANLTGCAIGALLTNAGSGYTSAPTVTASAGGSTWQAIVGGALNTSVTITTAGAGYNYPPQLVVSAPPTGAGVPATMTCTISGGAINAVTVVNQGAGYTAVPTITVVPDPREASASTPGPTTPAVLTAALTGSGTITAVLCTNHGTAQTSVPTLSFSGGGGSSAAATAIMCFTTTGYTVTTAGAAYGNAQPFYIQTAGYITSGSAAYTNPSSQTGLLVPRQALYAGTSTAGGAIQTGATAIDSGIFQAIPAAFVSPGNAVPTTQAVATMTVGGVSDISLVQPW